MCGIAGYFGKRAKSQDVIYNTLKSLNHRGPDSRGYYSFKDNYLNNIYFLHTRLSIIDLEKRSNQPFLHEGFVLIFNGEIYNYLEIKNLLISEGISFKTKGDTEVLMKALI